MRPFILLLIFLPITCMGIDDVAKSLLNEGVAFYNSKKFSESIGKMNEVLALDNTIIDAYITRGHSYAEIGSFELAYRDYEQALILSPNNSKVHFAIGVLLGEQKNYAEAIKHYNSAIDNDRKNIDAYINRGWMNIELKNMEIAKIDLSYALQLNPLNPHAISGLAEYEANKGDLLNALSLYNKAILLQKSDSILYSNRGKINCRLKNFKEAVSDFESALQIDDKYIGAYLGRGNCLAEMGEKNSAIKDYSRVLDIDAKNVTAFNNRAYTYFEIKEYSKSLDDYNQAIIINSKHADLYFGRSEVYEKVGKINMALEDAKTAVTLAPDNSEYKEWFNKLSLFQKDM